MNSKELYTILFVVFLYFFHGKQPQYINSYNQDVGLS